MTISPKQLLQGLLYTTPVLLLVLASCGGGGGSGGSASLAAPYTLSVSVAGISGVINPASGVTLRNGGDTITNPTIMAPGTYAFAHQVLSSTTYNINVLNQPTPTQLCTFANGKTILTGVMPASPTTVSMSCVAAYTIGGSITGSHKNGLVLQNNGADNYVVASGVNGTFTFSTPVAQAGSYNVTVLTNPPGQKCTPSANSAAGVGAIISTVTITCANNPTQQPDQHVYVVNYGSNNAWFYAASGVLTTPTSSSTLSHPSAIAVYGGTYAFVTNSGAHYVSSYSVSGVISTSPIANTLTGNDPLAIAVHPSGKFAYVANYTDNSVSGYSIDPTTGILSSIDTDGATTGNQTSIPTRSNPIAIAITPNGQYLYVANAISGDVSAYSIDTTTGALAPTDATGGGTTYITTGGNTPSAITTDPAGKYLYVVNRVSHDITIFLINSDGSLTQKGIPSNGTTPVAIALNSSNTYAYVLDAGTNPGIVYVYSVTGGTLSYVSQVPTKTSPISISIDSSGRYVYVANSVSNDISVYDTTTTPGVLTPVTCSSCGTGTTPYGITTSP